MKDYYKTTPENPYHVSVGALVYDENNKILAHYFDKIGRLEDICILVRESIEENETIEEAVKRGLLEEMGVTGEIEKYLGSIVANDAWFGEINRETIVEKTTIYFLVKLSSIDESKRLKDDNETTSQIIRMDAEDLIIKMQEQSKKYNVQDIDESKIVENARKLLKI